MGKRKDGQPGADADKNKDKNKNQNPPGGDADGGKAGDEGDGANDEGNESDDDESDDLEESEVPEKVKGYLGKLRKENAKHRTENKALKGDLTKLQEQLGNLTGGLKKALGIEDESEDPVKKAETLESRNGALEFELAMANAAREHGIPVEHDDYFRFLVNEKASKLKDDEELTDEQMGEIVAKVKQVAGLKKTSTTTESDSGNGNGQPPPKEGAGSMTVEQFNAMTTTQKSELYQKNRAEYERLYNASRGRK